MLRPCSRSLSVASVTLLLCACGSSSNTQSAAGTTVDLTTGEAAQVVIGQPDFLGSLANRGGAAPDASTIRRPWGSPTVAGGRLYLPDRGNNRILGFDAAPTVNGAAASFVLGQASMTTATSGRSATSFSSPDAVAASNGKLILADFGNSRILVWNTLPTATNTPADVVVGKSTFTGTEDACDRKTLSITEGATVAGGKLIVSDSPHNRVLVWNTIPTTDYPDADLVLGQADFTTCTAGAVSASSLAYPKGVWSDGVRLLVVDSTNRRVLLWNTFPTVNGQAADRVLGQPSFTDTGRAATAAGMSWPAGVASNGTQIAVADCWMNRVLVWNAFPAANGASADVVLGQATFTNNGEGTSATAMHCPVGVHLTSDLLLVSDFDNHRYLVFR